jgi:hypothetical protein
LLIHTAAESNVDAPVLHIDWHIASPELLNARADA